MKTLFCLSVLLFLLLASACRPATNVPLPTPSATASLPPTPDGTDLYQTAIAEKDTQIAEIAATRDFRASQTAAVVPSSTTTPTPWPTFTPWPTQEILFSTLKPIEGPVSSYRLAVPDPLALMELVQRREILFGEEDRWNGSGLILSEVDYEWARAFPKVDEEHLSVLIDRYLMEAYADQFALSGIFTDSMIQDLARAAFVRELNRTGAVLPDDTFVGAPVMMQALEAYPIELDGDPSSEWILLLESPNLLGFSMISMTLDQNSDGTYRQLANGIDMTLRYLTLWDPANEIRDMTGDGIQDAMIVQRSSGAGQFLAVYRMLVGGPDGLRLVSESSFRANMYGDYDFEGEWLISEENQLPVLRVIIYEHLPWDCQVDDIYEYQWVGGVERVVHIPPGNPTTTACAIARAVDPLYRPENGAAIPWLNLAYSDKALTPEVRVFILFRLALEHALIGESFASRSYLDLLAELAVEEVHPIAGALYSEIETMLGDGPVVPYKLCLAAESIAKEIPTGIGDPYPYVGFEEGYPTSLCQTRLIQEAVLGSITFSQNGSPETALLAAGLPIRSVFQVPLADGFSGWLALIEDENPNIDGDGNPDILEDYERNNWMAIVRYLPEEGWEELYRVHSPFDQIELSFVDQTNDDVPEISVIWPADANGDCNEGEQAYDFYITTALVGPFFISNLIDEVCSTEDGVLDLSVVLGDENGDGIVDLVADRLTDKDMDPDLLLQLDIDRLWLQQSHFLLNSDLSELIRKPDVLEDLTTRFFESLDPAAMRAELIFYRDRWGLGDDPLAENIRAHLNYLLALSYELEGEMDEAVQIYYEIWEVGPDSIWAYLAAAKLEKIN